MDEDAGMAEQVRMLEQQVAEQQVELEWLRGKNAKAHDLLDTVRSGLYKEVVDLRRKFNHKTIASLMGERPQENYEDEMTTFFDTSLGRLRDLGTRDAYSAAHQAPLRGLSAKSKARARTHASSPRRPGDIDGEDRLRQIVNLKEAENRKLRQKLDMFNADVIRTTVEDAKRELFELRESCYTIRHSIHSYRKWLQQNSIVMQVNEAVSEQNTIVTLLSGQLPLLTAMIETLFQQVSKVLAAPGHAFVTAENPWWDQEGPADMPDAPFKFEGCEEAFAREGRWCTKIYQLVAWFAGALKDGKEANAVQLAQIEAHELSIKELKAEKDFMQQQQEMLKATIEELANERKKKKNRTRSRKSLASRSSRGSRTDSVFSGVGSRSGSIASRKHRSQSVKRKSRKSLGGKRHSRARSSVAGSCYDDDSDDSLESSRSGATSLASGRSRSRGKKSRSRSSRAGGSRDRSRHHSRGEKSDRDRRRADADDSGTEVDESKSRGASSRASSRQDDDDIDSVVTAEYTALDDFAALTGRRLCGRTFIHWCKQYQKRYCKREMEGALTVTMHEAARRSHRAAALSSPDRVQQHNAAYLLRERIARLALPLHIPVPVSDSRPRTARPVAATLRHRPVPPRSAGRRPLGSGTHFDRAGDGPGDVPDLAWIQSWREMAHPQYPGT
eukprot:TRINITY_DN24820_c0_g1_i1.p1 TRINITY_DN24820_c0_g1~~TRINITY_DN24820_c0_g1_i1.p1  ORF type:complete len:671 (+),score=180.41 TRINITY_DN24820_c0_g1_i1:109-2121(+)